MQKVRKTNKIVNDFLSHLEGSTHHVELEDFDRLMVSEADKVQARMSKLDDFAATIRQEFASDYFSFMDIPDLIIKKNYPRKDYEECYLKVLNKVKLRYLAEKKRELPHRELASMVITDDDLVPLDMLDWVNKEVKDKMKDKDTVIAHFIEGCKKEVARLKAKGAFESEK